MHSIVVYSLCAAIDKWNYLWIGCGIFMHDGLTNSVLRIDTNNPGNPLRVFAMTHETVVHACSLTLHPPM